MIDKKYCSNLLTYYAFQCGKFPKEIKDTLGLTYKIGEVLSMLDKKDLILILELMNEHHAKRS